ncbi:MAG: RecQ family ATP-dependent DNA helicase [Candidatus Pacebacteria bacterium]|nr:RecQ family ATP-dependent DNA helicase [Candidatus Paceibacterota bacterium]
MLEKNLEKYFNFSEFRPGQREIVEAIVSGRDAVALMPTGGGKSLCYQLPAVILPGLTVVISPLIALMKDQVDALAARGIPATFINSTISSREAEKRIADIKSGKTKILYAAPERLAAPSFSAVWRELDIKFLAVDEAHCVSAWGHDFRPDYLNIKNYIKKLPHRPIVAAFTATATPEVKDDIIERLELENPAVFIRGFDRPNLKFFCEANIKPRQRYEEVLRIINSMRGAGIVYALTRKETEALAGYLKENNIQAEAYHAGMVAPSREKIQNDFMENKIRVIVATVAFGMGVDKADVRFVIHAGMPGSLEGYYQEAGRAGRDGEPAYCILLHSKKDSSTHKFFIRNNHDEMTGRGKSWLEARKISGIKYDRLEKIEEYVTSRKCRRKLILEYFNDPTVRTGSRNCGGCDVCLGWKADANKVAAARSRVEKPFLSSTVKVTVDLYNLRGYEVAQIAKMRGLGESTIIGHLIDWYQSGGELDVDKLVTPLEQSRILEVIAKVGLEKFGPIKSILPEEISYEKIKLVAAKVRRGK